MKIADRRKRMVVFASACALAIGYGTFVPERESLPMPQIRLADASSFLNLFPPVKEPASNPGDSR